METFTEFTERFIVAVFGNRLLEEINELLLQLAEVDTILRAFRSRHRRLYVCEVYFKHLRVVDLAAARDAKEPLRSEVTAESVYGFFGATGCFKVLAGL